MGEQDNIPSPGAETAKKFALELKAPVIPTRGKKSWLADWQKLTLEETLEEDFLKHFDSHDVNVAISLGEVAGGLCTIDCDLDAFLEEMLVLNPRFIDTLISRGERGGNIWLRIKGAYPGPTPLLRGDDKCGEWRSSRNYTLIYGTHPAGMSYQRNNHLPIEITYQEIQYPKDIQAPIISPSPSHSPSPLSAPLHAYTTARLHNTPIPDSSPKYVESSDAQAVLRNVQETKEAEEEFEKSHPHLVNLYTQLVRRRFTARPHQRNDFLVDAVPFLYQAVAPEIILIFVEQFYLENQHLFNDPIEKHMYEARKMIETVGGSYLDKLTPIEKEIYAALNEVEQDAFRILRDLAFLDKPGKPSLTFHMSNDQLAARLGIYSMQANRLLGKFIRLRIIDLATEGTMRSAGQAGRAALYRYTLLQKADSQSK